MKKTKAAFRAIREECGLSQQDIADNAGVSILTVKRWENLKYPKMPPDDVWLFVNQARAAMYEDACTLADEVIEAHRTTGLIVSIDYYHSQDDLDNIQLKSGVDVPVGYYNARARLIGQMLDKAEVPYTYEYARFEGDKKIIE